MPRTEAEVDVLRRVARGAPLCQDDHEPVLSLISDGLMHVTPTYNREDRCPYRLTDAGQNTLRSHR